MPTVDVAMAQSLRPGIVDKLKESLARSISQTLSQRSIISDAQGKVTDVKTAFSSWDNCMSVAWCKWPVIAVIVVGALIIIGIVWCIARCVCCGVSCCCGCFRCLKCCGECCGMCDPPKGKQHKYLDEPFIPPHQGYRTEAPMQAHHFPPSAPPSAAPYSATSATATPPQYAEFDTQKKGGEDALPQMPSWEGAGSKKVMLEEEEVEMDQLKKSPADGTQSPMPGQPAGHLSGHTSPMPMDHPGQHQDQYMAQHPGQHPGQHLNQYDRMQPSPSPSGYHPGHAQTPDPYAQPGHGYNAMATRESVGFGLDQPYDDPSAAPPLAAAAVPAAAAMSPYGRQSPAPHSNGYGSVPAAPQGYAEMPTPSPSRGPAGPNGFTEMPTPPVDMDNRDAYGQGQLQSPRRDPQRGYPHGDRHGTSSPAPGQGYGMRSQGPPQGVPDGYGMKRTPTGENFAAAGGRRTPGMDPRDPRMRNSPGPRRTPGPQGEHPFAQSPRRSPAAPRDHGYGTPPGPPGHPRDNYNRSYSPAPDRHQAAASPRPLQRPPQPQQQPYAQSPPQSPIVNNGGFDFTSGFARPSPETTDRRPSEPREEADQEAYPGYKSYKPAQQGWSGV